MSNPYNLAPQSPAQVIAAPPRELKTLGCEVAAAEVPDTRELFSCLWHFGEICCLFADSNVGKSVFAIQIADKVAREGHKVLIYDFEMDAGMYRQRYSNDKGEIYPFSDNLLKPPVDFSMLITPAATRLVLGQIERDMDETGARVVIIDNLTAVCSASETGIEATKFVFALQDLGRRKKASILVVAHTPKRDMMQPLTQNDLGGSKRLFNFFDSVFALGLVPSAPDQRYLKQLKCRAESIRYNDENVVLYEIEKRPDGFLGFRSIGNGNEFDILGIEKPKRGRPFSISDEKRQEIRKLKAEGKKASEIAEKFGLSERYVYKIVNGN